jgi:Fe-S-cluster containining protein
VEDIQNLVYMALKEISEYCINECHAFCCRKGYLILKPEEVELVVGDKKDILIENGDLKEMNNGKFSLNLGNFFGNCPQLENFKCKIHTNNKRPATCKDFPIFIVGREIKISSRCPAKRENKFFRLVKEAEKNGYKIVENFS